VNRLPDERDMDQVVRSWMREEDEHAADRNRQIGRIMGRADETHQRRGAWRFLPFGRGKRHVDRDDEELYAAGSGAVAMRRGVSSAMALAAVAALVLTAVAFLALIPRTMAPGAGVASPTPAATVHPDDEELMAAMAGVWSGARTSLDDVLAVYDEDAVHTALWHDRVDRVRGATEILERIRGSSPVDPTPWIRLPDPPGVLSTERRYMGASGNLGGIACVVSVRDGRIRRHDCILPIASTSPVPEWDTVPADTLEVRERMWESFVPGFGSGDRALIDATVSPSIVHHVAYLTRETLHSGRDHYMAVTGRGEPKELADPIPLPAPEGEHRWTDYNDIVGGTLCTFWARDEMLIRHDCIVPSS
jgi:hypothetical protein